MNVQRLAPGSTHPGPIALHSMLFFLTGVQSSLNTLNREVKKRAEMRPKCFCALDGKD